MENKKVQKRVKRFNAKWLTQLAALSSQAMLTAQSSLIFGLHFPSSGLNRLVLVFSFWSSASLVPTFPFWCISMPHS